MRTLSRFVPVVALGSVLVLSACIEPMPPAAPPLPTTAACKAPQFQGLIGQQRSVLDGMLLPAGARIIGPHDPVTADFNGERLNFEIGVTGRIEKVSCF
ncbi:hypothetical protein DRW48_04240 [Paracoccus suum]|uniref:Peptidase inhibitor I78 n=1 Tax=Paracoccus suum TaxID=2259340 RepID=A0A344PI02_9RHOB|nr:I78 family peptidase inhibitor [Paracoccus suum]AXC49007.1 hypothetical protein DRW48_04240 [Paracoccus suum]